MKSKCVLNYRSVVVVLAVFLNIDPSPAYDITGEVTYHFIAIWIRRCFIVVNWF